MKKLKRIISVLLTMTFLLGTLPALSLNIMAANPYLPLWEHLPDGEPRVFEHPPGSGKFRAFIIGSHDVRQTEYCGPDIKAWSAPVEDLTQWTDHGPVFTYQASNGQWDLMYAPDMFEVKRFPPEVESGVVPRTADMQRTVTEFYLFPHSMTGGRSPMVCKGPTALGPFEPINLNANGSMMSGSILGFDPSGFVDYIDDPADPDYQRGFRAYAYWGFAGQQGMFAAELNPDTMWSTRPGTRIIANFLPTSTSYGVIRNPHIPTNHTTHVPYDPDNPYPHVSPGAEITSFNFFEAASIRKVGNKYVMIISGYSGPDYGMGSTNSALRYTVGDSPMGPWGTAHVLVDSRGPVLNQSGTGIVGGSWAHNTHGSIEKINDTWYAFYHRPPRGFSSARQAAVGAIHIEVDPEDKPVAEGGWLRIRALDMYADNKTWTARTNAGVEYTGVEVTSEGFQIYGLDPHKYISAGYVTDLQNGGGATTILDSYDIWDNHMTIENVRSASRVGFKYFGFGGLTQENASKVGLRAFDGTKPGDTTMFNLWLTPKTSQEFKVNVWLNGPWDNATWNGVKIGEIVVPAGSAQEPARFQIDVSAFVNGLDKKNAIYLVAEGTAGVNLCDYLGLGFSTPEKPINRFVPPSASVFIDGYEIELPARPVASTAINGLYDYTNYATTYYTPFKKVGIPQVTASTNSPDDVDITIVQSTVPGGNAVVTFKYNGVPGVNKTGTPEGAVVGLEKIYTINITEPVIPTISMITLGDSSLPNFRTNIEEYNFSLPLGTTQPPVVGAEYGANPDDQYLTVTITQAQSIPGTATVNVKTDEGHERTYRINFSASATLLSHTMATRAEYDAVVGAVLPPGSTTADPGYFPRNSNCYGRKNPSWDANTQSMRWNLEPGAWASGGVAYDITSLVSAFPPGTELTLSMEVRPETSTAVRIGFAYDNQKNNNPPTGGHSYQLPGLPTNSFTPMEYRHELQTYANRVVFFVYIDQPAIRLRNIRLEVAPPEELPTLSVIYDGNGSTGGDVPVDEKFYDVFDRVTVLGQGSLINAYHEFIGWERNVGQVALTDSPLVMQPGITVGGYGEPSYAVEFMIQANPVTHPGHQPWTAEAVAGQDGKWSLHLPGGAGGIGNEYMGQPLNYRYAPDQPETIFHKPGDTFVMPNHNVELRAVWEPVEPEIPITFIRINALVIETVRRGQERQFTVTLNDGASDANIVWTISNQIYATVTDDGVVTVKNLIGNVVLTATDPVSGLKASIGLRIAS